MGNCFSNKAAGQSSIGGTAFSQSTTSNVAIDCFLLSRGYRGLYSQIELSFSASNLRDRDIFSKMEMERIKLGSSDKEAYTQSIHSNTSSPKKFSVDIMNHHIFLFIGLEDQILEAGADILVTSSYQIGSAVGGTYFSSLIGGSRGCRMQVYLKPSFIQGH
uniref:Uncharacterized protein n=1 Tax=Cucumis melo TaxID=3656 RepID=A0A9I9E6Q7_CUCME